MMYRSSSILPAGCAVLGILLALAAALPSPAGAQTPTPPPQLTGFDSRLDPLLFALTALPDHAPFAFRVDVYAGPNGAGYMVIAQSRIAGQLWERTINAGPETWREQGWIKSVIA